MCVGGACSDTHRFTGNVCVRERRGGDDRCVWVVHVVTHTGLLVP